MKISRKTTLISVLLVPLLAAIAVRFVLYIFWLESPVRYYSSISGLDMQTTLIIGSWLYQGFSIFTVHKFMIAAVMFFNKGQHCPEALVLIQMILGAAAAPLIAWSALHLTGKRIWAMLAGLTAAMYAPALLYESITLRESTQTFFAALSLFGLLWARKRHFDIPGIIVAGVCLSLPCLNRISSVPFLLFGVLWIALYLFLKNRKKQHPYKLLLTKMGVMALVLAVVFVPVSLFNSKRSSFNLPFHIDLNYALKLGKIEKPKDMNVGPLQAVAPETKPQTGAIQATAANIPPQEHYGILRYSQNCINKFYLLFKPFEIANNTNYYFMKYKLFPLQYLTGPLLVIPLAFAAILFMLCSWQWMKKEGLLLLYILAYAMPLVFFYPLARYRLIMYPVFCILMFYPFYQAYTQIKRRNTVLMILPMLLLYISVFIVTLPEDISIRPTDYIAYGKAVQYQAGKATGESGEYFKYAIEQYPDYIPGYVNYADNLIKMGQYQQANTLLTDAYARFNGDTGIAYYYGISLLGTRNPAKAESVFRKMPVPGADSSDARSQYYYCLGEALRLQNKLPQALESYKTGLESASAGKKEILLKVIAAVEKKLQQSPQTLLNR